MNDRFKFRAWDIEEQKYREVIALGQDRSFLLNIGHVRNDTQIFEQCTGLKDKNGKLIYEGDIILVEDNKCPIEWESENARYNVVGYGEIAYLNYNDIEVIGNVHENEDLIKVGVK